MAITPEEVLINIRAKNYASKVLTQIGDELKALQNIASSVGTSLKFPSSIGGSGTNSVTQIAYDFNQVREQIINAQKALNGFGNSPKSSNSSLDDALKQLEQIRSIGQNSIKINIDKGNVKSVTEDVHKLNMWAEKMKSSFVGVKTKDFQLVGQSYNPSNFTLIGEGSVKTEAPFSKGELVPRQNFSIIREGYDDAVKGANNFAKASQESGRTAYSSFHQLNNMLIVVGGAIQDIGTKIAGVFGAAGLSGMIQKMWQGASQRQQNMMYLMHQKGKEKANQYYDEIMQIVTELPGDDTFLTNILNMASALDKSLKLDNLKEAGTAITDYYMAATMKGENSYETQKDIRKYITTGDTRGMRNSVLASEIDSLKEKKNVLERIHALEKALDKTGFKGMSEYESATNELEEFKGHFQKAFADLGGAIILVVQPLMKFYNTLDTIFGSRISQLIIVMATALVALFTTIGGGLILVSSSFRMIETITLAMEGLSFALSINVEERGIYNTLLLMSMSYEEREKVLKGEMTLATWSETVATIKNTIARKLGVTVQEEEVVSTWALIGATFGLIKAKILLGIETIKFFYSIISEVIWTWRNTDAKLSEAIAIKLNFLAEQNNTMARIRNVFVQGQEFIMSLKLCAQKVVELVLSVLNGEATYGEAYAHMKNAFAKILETDATFGLATATAILNALLAPEVLIILAIVGAVILLVVAIEKLGEALGWWKDFGSMFQAISDGINRMWNAFMNSDVVQGIIQYFGDFIATIQDAIGSIINMFKLLFGWTGDGGTFDIVQSYIDAFGKLGEVIKWVWNILDDWSNSPLGIITWLNPLGILIFHLDEIGSFIEDIRDAVDRFINTSEFQELVDGFNQAFTELQEPFQEIWSLINEIIGLFGEIFGGEDPVGQGTEERINMLVELLKGFAFIIKSVVIPAIRTVALIIKIVLTPLKAILTVIREIIHAIQWASQMLEVFRIGWDILLTPVNMVLDALKYVGNLITQVSDAIKNSIIGKLLGWDKSDEKKNENEQTSDARTRLYDSMKQSVQGSDMNFITKRQILGELDKQSVNSGNVNEIRNLGQTYNNNTNNQRQVVINQNFAQGSMPIDARNMTKKEARQMFIGAFGYRRAVGSKGILK